VGEGDVEQWFVAERRDRHAPAQAGGRVGRQRWDVVAGEYVVDELLLLGRQQPANRLPVEPALVRAGVLLRQEQIEPVRPALHLRLDPAEIDLEPLGRVRDRAEHTEPAGVGDRRDDVSAVAEGEDRELDPEQLAHTVLHQAILALDHGSVRLGPTRIAGTNGRGDGGHVAARPDGRSLIRSLDRQHQRWCRDCPAGSAAASAGRAAARPARQ
jgi:hypothetical protein